jgi:hypothetical protein
MRGADPPSPAGAAADGVARTVVLLGASNLTMSLPTVVHLALQRVGGPARFLIAVGHGRSYGLTSRVLCRTLPSIESCGLWDALASRETGGAAGHDRPTFALVTDIGNDLGYGQPAARLVEWVRGTLERLRGVGANVVMTALPLPTLSRLSSRRYAFYRSLLFPGLRLSRDELVGRARDADAALSDAARGLGFAVVEHDADWYGLDPIHIRRRHRLAAYGDILMPWSAGRRATDAEGPTATQATRALGRRLRRCAPQQKWVCGVERNRRQPCGSLPDGSTIAMY